jgi:hypothetical protein
MRHDAGGESHRKTNLVQVVAQLAHQRFLGAWTSQQQTIRGQRIKRAEEAKALDELTNERVHRDHSFSLQLAERHMNRPMIRAGGVETIAGKIDGFADAHAGVAKQQEHIAGEIVATQ